MNIIQKLSFATVFALAMGTAVTSDAQLIVKIRPRAPRTVVVRPEAPSPRHVWVQEDWRENGGRYEYSGGHWVEPPRAGARWVPGHWKNTPRRGWVWKPGHWR